MLSKGNHFLNIIALTSLTSLGLTALPAQAQDSSTSPIPILEEITTAGEPASEPIIVPAAGPGPIISPVSAVVNSGGTGAGNIINTINQSGLSPGFISGVTIFDTYLGGSPLHNDATTGEWFSNTGTTSAVVTYDFGAPSIIDRLALWNEDSAGIGRLDLYQSLDGVTFIPLKLNIIPTNNPIGSPYPAQVITFPLTNARYVRFNMSDCPQSPSSVTACSIGEVAFRTPSGPEPFPRTPEPSTLVGLLLLGGLGLKQKAKVPNS